MKRMICLLWFAALSLGARAETLERAKAASGLRFAEGAGLPVRLPPAPAVGEGRSGRSGAVLRPSPRPARDVVAPPAPAPRAAGAGPLAKWGMLAGGALGLAATAAIAVAAPVPAAAMVVGGAVGGAAVMAARPGTSAADVAAGAVLGAGWAIGILVVAGAAGGRALGGTLERLR